MKTSPAIRIYGVLRRAHDLKVNSPMHAAVVWARVFGIDIPHDATHVSPLVEDAVLARLRDLREDLGELERSVAGTEKENAVEPVATTIRHLTAASQLGLEWSNVKTNFLRPDFLVGLYWASLSLPTDDDGVTEESVRKLQEELADLEKAIADEQIPTELRKFIARQIKNIQSAMSRYDVRGIEPLRRAVQEGLGELVLEQDSIRKGSGIAAEKGSAVGGKLKKVWTSAVAICGDVEKLNKGIAVISKVYEKLLPLLPP